MADYNDVKDEIGLIESNTLALSRKVKGFKADSEIQKMCAQIQAAIDEIKKLCLEG